MNFKQYAQETLEISKALFAIDSPTGFTEKVSQHVLETAQAMGYPASVSYTHLDVYKRQIQCTSCSCVCFI